MKVKTRHFREVVLLQTPERNVDSMGDVVVNWIDNGEYFAAITQTSGAVLTLAEQQVPGTSFRVTLRAMGVVNRTMRFIWRQRILCIDSVIEAQETTTAFCREEVL